MSDSISPELRTLLSSIIYALPDGERRDLFDELATIPEPETNELQSAFCECTDGKMCRLHGGYGG